MLKKCIFALLLTCLLAGSAVAAPADQTPLERIKEGTEKLISLLSDPAMTNPDEHDAAVTRLRKAAEEYIDFGLVTKYAVGKPWLKMTPQMRQDLTEAFVRLLERSYLRRIPAYGGQKVNYTREQVSGKKAKVITEIVDKDKKVVVEFRLRIVQGQWMIYDVVAEGVSLVMNYRSQFSQVLNDGTPEDLLQLINDRIEAIDKGQETKEDAAS